MIFTQGQCCCAGSRTFVEDDIYDEFVEKSAIRAKSRTVGNPFDPNIEHGPQVDEDQLNKILSMVDSGKKEGAKLITGGTRIGHKGYFVAPTVFADVQDDMTIAREEVNYVFPTPINKILIFAIPRNDCNCLKIGRSSSENVTETMTLSNSVFIEVVLAVLQLSFGI